MNLKKYKKRAVKTFLKNYTSGKFYRGLGPNQYRIPVRLFGWDIFVNLPSYAGDFTVIIMENMAMASEERVTWFHICPIGIFANNTEEINKVSLIEVLEEILRVNNYVQGLKENIDKNLEEIGELKINI